MKTRGPQKCFGHLCFSFVFCVHKQIFMTLVPPLLGEKIVWWVLKANLMSAFVQTRTLTLVQAEQTVEAI